MSIESRLIAAVKQILPEDLILVLSGRNGNVPKTDYCLIHFFEEEKLSTPSTQTKITYIEGDYIPFLFDSGDEVLFDSGDPVLTYDSDDQQSQIGSFSFVDSCDFRCKIRFTFVGKSDGKSDENSKLFARMIDTHRGKKYFHDNDITISSVTNRLRFDDYADTESFVRFVIDIEVSYVDYFEYEDEEVKSISTEGTLLSQKESVYTIEV